MDQTHAGDLGRRSLYGSFESEKLFHELEPDHVPRPLAFGSYRSDPETWFFLADFHNMVNELPEVKTLVSAVVGFHRKSMGKSPNGKWGFHTETGLPFVHDDNGYESSWEALFAKMMKKMLEQEVLLHGQNDELDDLSKALFERVIPRLLRPLESHGRFIQPCLIHTDLWPGNIYPDRDTGRILIFDSRAIWGHNECDLGTWKAPRFMLGTAFIEQYQQQMGPSEPQKDWADRHALYAL